MIINKTDFMAIIAEIKTARNRALQNVNKELVTLYWNIGKQISEKLKTSQWAMTDFLRFSPDML
ncbi:MAG: DUF1016 domain-containing protein [Desulfobacterales bacterium]|nr:DUF1016 domain-containing protein [Desulfobacterales bacterium]